MHVFDRCKQRVWRDILGTEQTSELGVTPCGSQSCKPQHVTTPLAEWGLLVFLLITLLCVFVPFLPSMPNRSLDPSWAFGMNQAVAQGLRFGKELVFAFGPYSFVFSKMFHPGTDGLMLVASIYLALSYAFALAQFRGQGKSRLLLLFGVILGALMGVIYSRDALLFSYSLLAGVCAVRFSRAGAESNHELAAIALLYAPLGLLPLIKASSLFLCGLVVGLGVMLMLVNKRPKSAVAIMAAFTMSLVAWWAASGQRSGDLVVWLGSILPVISGYTEAMSIDGPGREIVWYLIAAGIVLPLVSWRGAIQWCERAYLGMLFFGYLFVAFKAGFVRHDIHAMVAGTSLMFAAMFAALLVRKRLGYPLVILGVVVCIAIANNYVQITSRHVAASLGATYRVAWQGLSLRVMHPEKLEAHYRGVLGALRALQPIPRAPGKFDIYSYQQAYLLASGNQWSPRPVFQSYSAYTPSLLAANREHIAGAKAPDYIAFKLETIDGRVPSGDDGVSWHELLQRYDLSGEDDEYLYLRKRAQPRGYETHGIGVQEYRLNERVELPVEHALVFAKIDVKPSIAGRFLSTIYKTRPLLVRLELEDSSVRVYRLIPGITRQGLFITPLIESTNEFRFLYAEPAALQHKRVRFMTIASLGGDWQWLPAYSVEYVGVSVSRTVAPSKRTR
jgi:hypothetical protein